MLPITRFVLVCTLRQHFGKYNVQMFLKKIFMVIHSKLHSCDVFYVVKSKLASLLIFILQCIRLSFNSFKMNYYYRGLKFI